jgi:hypothetical protein
VPSTSPYDYTSVSGGAAGSPPLDSAEALVLA